MKNPYQDAMKQYRSIELQTRVDTANPHELIDMLLQGARTHIASAQGFIQRQQAKEKGEHIGKAISILEGLKTSLNHEAGGDIAVNLSKLYDYIQNILLKANLDNNPDLLTQANLLLADIHEAWQAIPNHATS